MFIGSLNNSHNSSLFSNVMATTARVGAVSLFLVTTACSTQGSLSQGMTKAPIAANVDKQADQSGTRSLHVSDAALEIMDASQTAALEEQWGVRITGLRTSMASMLVDFRFKVLDPVKAAPLLDQNKQAFMQVESTGKVLSVPNTVKIGALRQTTNAKNIKKGTDYFVLFGNPRGSYAKPGSKVAVIIGDFRAEHLTLQ